MIKEIWNSWWFQNLLVVLLLAVLTLIGWRLSRREYWRLAYREVRQRRGAVICFFVLLARGLTAPLPPYFSSSLLMSSLYRPS